MEKPGGGRAEIPVASTASDRNKGQSTSHDTMSMRPSSKATRAASGSVLNIVPPAGRFIREIYAEKSAASLPVVSIELFPPKTPQGEKNLFERTLPNLVKAKPDFCSVTYGAGGSTHDKTLEVVDRIQRQYSITGMAHLTCISSSRDEIEGFLQDSAQLGIRNILALRGDPPRDIPNFSKLDNGFNYSYQLIDFIRSQGEFSIGTAGFPESHMACDEGKQVDWQRLKTKIDHGADFVITQLFFDNADYFEFMDYMVGTLGVTVPITPGILPIISTEQVERFTALCGARLPEHVTAQLNELGEDRDGVIEFGIDLATRQCEELLRGGAPGLHLYSLNKSRSSLQILRNLGLVAS